MRPSGHVSDIEAGNKSSAMRGFQSWWALEMDKCGWNYESFDLSKTHSLSAQDLVKIFID